MTARLRLAAFAAMLLRVATAVAASPAESAPMTLERIALGELGGWITLQVSVGGEAGRWLLDTGASRNLVSPALARRLGLTAASSVQAQTPLGAVQGGEVDLPALNAGGLPRSGQRALVVDPAVLLGAAADGIDGVLGVPWLSGLRAELDLRGWTVTWHAGDPVVSDCPQGLTPVPLTRLRGLPVIELAVGGAAQRYVLDTGNPAGLIRIEAAPADAGTPGLELPGGLRLTVLAQAVLGPQVRSQVPVLRLSSAALKRSFGDAAQGLAGLAFLDGARWSLDLEHDRLCVEAGRFATPGGFGLVPEHAGEALRVAAVLPGSPAARAGLRAGDTLVRWAGLPASRPLPELWRATLEREEISLDVLDAGGATRTLTLRRAIFAPAAP